MARRRKRDYSTDQRKSRATGKLRNQYPPDWDDIRAALFARAESRCEGAPGAPCGAEAGGLHPVTGARVRLQAAHLDGDVLHNSPENLRLLCDRCHITFDFVQHGYSAAWRAISQEIGLWDV